MYLLELLCVSKLFVVVSINIINWSFFLAFLPACLTICLQVLLLADMIHCVLWLEEYQVFVSVICLFVLSLTDMMHCVLWLEKFQVFVSVICLFCAKVYGSHDLHCCSVIFALIIFIRHSVYCGFRADQSIH